MLAVVQRRRWIAAEIGNTTPLRRVIVAQLVALAAFIALAAFRLLRFRPAPAIKVD